MKRFIKYISAQFKRPQGIWGRLISLIQNIFNAEMYTAAASQLMPESNMRILDVGYGNGYLLKLIYEKTGAHLYGIDISDDAFKMACRRNRSAERAGKLHLEIGDCCNLKYERDFFTAVTSINTIYFWQDTIQGLSEIRRVLMPGKAFYNIVYTVEYLNTIRYTQYGYRKFTPVQLVEMGYAAGFSKVEVRDIRRGKSFIVIYTK